MRRCKARCRLRRREVFLLTLPEGGVFLWGGEISRLKKIFGEVHGGVQNSGRDGHLL